MQGPHAQTQTGHLGSRVQASEDRILIFVARVPEGRPTLRIHFGSSSISGLLRAGL